MKKTLLRHALVCVWGLLFGASSALCQWVYEAPTPCTGGLTIQGTSIFAGFGCGVLINGDLPTSIWRSPDTGKSWVPSDTGMHGNTVLSLFAKDSILLAGTEGNGIFRSTDSGKTWSSAQIGLDISEVNSFMYLKGNFFAGIWSNSLRGRILRSTDFGKSWVLTPRSRSGDQIYSMSADDTSVIATSWSSGLLWSTNMGNSWLEMNSPEPISGGGFPFHSVLFTKKYLFLGSDGVWRAPTNKLFAWEHSSNGLPDLDGNNAITSIIAVDTDIYICYSNGIAPGNVYRSTDYGNSWKNVSLGESHDYQNLSVLGPSLFAASTSGVFRRSLSDFAAVRPPSLAPNSFNSKDQLEIFDLLGRLLYRGRPEEQPILPKGLYFIWTNGIVNKVII